MSASGESSTTMYRLLHASGSHPIPMPYDPKRVGKRVKVRRLSCRVSMTFRIVRTNQYNQDLGLIHSTNGNHLESPNEGSSIDHQVTIYLHAQNITMFPTNESCSSSSGSRAEFCGFYGGKHSSTQCIGVQGSCSICGQYWHSARVCPSAGSQQAVAPPQGRGGSSRGRSPQFPQPRVGEMQFRPFQLPGPSRFGQSSQQHFSGSQHAQANAITREQAEGTSSGVIADVTQLVSADDSKGDARADFKSSENIFKEDK
ncbi:hypothetical protein F511_16490 [Dorcoceras hygrometricum]|uniref:Uncharacterized protein n=1 Tax=Dorcoceras hygrometricum TaxID=472368 RepID=A0A2Z7BGV7_9LAMI|nr:hypothetical protein F511_16490 [Dorcoceras hygrometricum]